MTATEPNAHDPLEARRLRLERDLYLGLLNLDEAAEPEQFTEQALRLVVEIVGAKRGYLELSDPSTPGNREWWTAAGWSSEEVAEIRINISRGIIAHAIAQGEVISVPSALLDPRFRDRQSVRRWKIEAVLCVPIGQRPPIGVLYLQERVGDGPFSDSEVQLATTFARYMVGLSRRVLERPNSEDPISALRHRMLLQDVVGQSNALARALAEAEVAARLDACVLITGDTGTGKTQLARVIHDNSTRAKQPFVTINCAAIPEALMENELFGAEAGAHSTAAKALVGKVAAAQGGTLFLDEIAELSVTAQAKLLQLLQNKEYYPLGSARSRKADLRIIAATNADLQERIALRTFREDLYYRLQVLSIKMPNLRSRQEDLDALARHFCQQACRQHGLRELSLSPSALSALRAREWPGNVRELEHVIETGVLRASFQNVGQLEVKHLFPDAAPQTEEGRSFQEETRRFQRDLLCRALIETDWNITETARRLDLARAHIYNLIKSFGISRDQMSSRRPPPES
ncbi:MAG TPA: sigma-54-dependent Fis family transcriptional regulator [Polyangiaceae bacterium]|nr:sigma-54-dependent Fis family transcriptional regulator [Polyangiaceae bacterium]